jgi:hypothetical protein
MKVKVIYSQNLWEFEASLNKILEEKNVQDVKFAVSETPLADATYSALILYEE